MKKSDFTKLAVLVGLLISLLSTAAYADRDRYEHKSKRAYPQKDYRFDKRYSHDRYYPRSGVNIKVLPHHHYRVPYRDSYYYFSGGVWYRPSGSLYVVVRPPIGVYVPILPVFYTTIWYHGVPYYYANDVYYVWRPDRNAYMVTEPPPDITQEPVPVADELYIYPMKGQSEQQQADDRYQCHRWGVDQTSYDPTQPPQGVSVSELGKLRENYQRAMRACLEGRGYSVR